MVGREWHTGHESTAVALQKTSGDWDEIVLYIVVIVSLLLWLDDCSEKLLELAVWNFS